MTLYVDNHVVDNQSQIIPRHPRLFHKTKIDKIGQSIWFAGLSP